MKYDSIDFLIHELQNEKSELTIFEIIAKAKAIQEQIIEKYYKYGLNNGTRLMSNQPITSFKNLQHEYLSTYKGSH